MVILENFEFDISDVLWIFVDSGFFHQKSEFLRVQKNCPAIQGFHQLKGYAPKEGDLDALALSDEDFSIQKICQSQRTIWDSGIFQMF